MNKKLNNQKYPDPLSGACTPFGISMRKGLQSMIRQYSKETGIPIAKLVEFALIKELRSRGLDI